MTALSLRVSDRPVADPRWMKPARWRGGSMMVPSSDRGRRSLVRESPVASWTRGASKTPTGARAATPGARLLDFVLLEAPTPAAQVWRRRHGSHAQTGSRSRCPQGDGRGLRAADGGPQIDAGMPDLRDNDGGSVGLAGLADGEPGHACRDGGDRGVLDAGVEDPERGRVWRWSWPMRRTSSRCPAARRT